MKICTLQVMIATVLCGVAAAHTTYAQLLEKKVTLSLNAVPLETALKQIEEATHVKFFFSVDQLELEEEISIEVVDKSLGDVLDEMLEPHQITYKVHEKELTITLKKRRGVASEEARLSNEKKTSVQTVGTITGKVKDAVTQQGMAGVNVVIKGTTVGTTTDADGRFSLQADDKDILVFSFIGYTTFEAQVNGRIVFDVVLQEDITSLKEVVVNAGYYTTTRETQTGNIAKVESKDIQKQPVSNPLAALQGRVPGLEIIQQNGVPGGNFKVRIRGTNSIANGNDPLYIIDGVPYTSTSMSFVETSGNILGSPSPIASQGSSPLNSLNPSDIESIEVLKDADATAIYGSRGANGVLLITTKKGKIGKTKVDFNFYTGAAKVPNKMNLLSTEQYIEMREEAFVNDNIIPTAADAPDLLVWDTTRYTNWQKELIGGSAQITDAQLSISGGEKNTQFLIGGGFHKETTVFPGNNADQRISIHANITNASHDQKLKTSFSINYSVNYSDLLSEDLTNRALTLPPNAPALYDEKGELSWTNWNAIENPLAFLKRKYESTTNNLFGNAIVSYAILPTLEIKTNLGYTNINGKAITVIPISSQNPAGSFINRSVFSGNDFQNWIVEPQLNWKPKVGEGLLDILLGTTFLDQKSEGLAQYANDFSSEALMKNIGAASTIFSSTNYYSQYRYHAIFGRINYALKERYIINLTGRRDGSSRFGPGKQFAVFGAIGSAWVFSREDFVKNGIPFLSFGKIRASYGTTGNDQIGDYQFLDTYTSSGPYQGKIGLTPVRLNNPDFAWETNKKLEGGIDLGFVKDRISIGVSYYRNRSSNQLIGFPLAPTAGFSSIQGNFPATTQNTGIELELNTLNIQTTDFSWSTFFNVTVPRNKLVEFPDLESFPVYANAYVVGKSLEIIKLYRYSGIDPTSGVYQFEDVNGDESYTEEDRQTIRFVGRNFYGGIQNNFHYKGFQLDVLVQYVKQEGYNSTHLFYYPPGTEYNQPDIVMNRWQQPDDDSEIQFFTANSAAASAYSNLFYYSDQGIADASFIRLKNLSISYSLPANWIQKFYVTNASVFVQGQNLFTITKYDGLDPETPGSNNLPPLRTITGGIHLTF